MDLNTSHLIEYLTNITTIQEASVFLEAALQEGLKIAQAQSGIIAIFDYEEGQEAGAEVEILRRYLAYQMAQARTTYAKLGLSLPSVNPLGIWLPKFSTVYEVPATIQAQRLALVVPICVRNSNNPVGFMLLLVKASGKPDFTLAPADQTALNAFSEATANNWLNLRSFTNISHRLDNLVMLTDIAALITANRNLPELLQQIMTTTAQLLEAETCTLMLLDHNTNELVFRVPDTADKQKLREFRQPIGRGICGYVARIGEATIVNDVESDARFNHQVDQSTGFHTRSVVCAPMLAHSKTIGVIEAINKREGKFTKNDVVLLNTLAAQAAIAIENAQLYASLTAERDKLIAKEEEVRRDLSRDLHDGPAQVISGIAMRISIIKKYMQNEPEHVLPELEEVEKVALNTAKDIRTMMFGLRPLMLETQGLIPTLEAYVEKLQTEPWQTHLEVEGFKLPDEGYRRLAHNVENTLFIIIQEAINNIRKHAQPRNVWIRLSYSEKETVIMVQDDGKGFDMDTVSGRYEERGSFGLLNMRERARLINASYYMSSKLGQGTSIIMIMRPEEQTQIITGPLTANLPEMFQTTN